MPGPRPNAAPPPSSTPGPGPQSAPGHDAGAQAASAFRAAGAGPIDASPAVEVSGLVKRYDGRAVVDGLSLIAPRGQVTAVLGPNGAGKTTTVEICQGLRSADAGTVRVLGLDPARDGARLRSRVGVMPQDGGLPLAARPAELLRLYSAMYADPWPADAIVTALGLDERTLRRPIRRLSGGQKQRVSLALAVLGRPEVVFLDEPTAGLDPQARLAVWALIRHLRSVGTAIVLTTHLMDEAERLADTVVVVDAGRVVAAGTPDELTHAGAERHLQFRARTGLDLAGLRVALPATVTAVEQPPGQYRLTGEITPALLATVTAWCAQHGVLAEDLRVGARTLEDVFLEKTGRTPRP